MSAKSERHNRLQVKNITIDKQAVYVDWELSAIGDGTGQKLAGRATLWRDDTRGLSAALDRLHTVCRDGLAELIGDYTYGLEDEIPQPPPTKPREPRPRSKDTWAPPPAPPPDQPLPSRPSWEDKP